MAIKFCPNCENLLRKRRTDNGDVSLYCKCGFETILEGKEKFKPLTDNERKRRGMATKTVVIESNDFIENPTTEVVCPKCQHTKAEYFQYQTRSADEPATTFYRCLNCNHRWREY